MGQPKQVNPATYLGGGRDFGALIPNSGHIISRNLTPDSTRLSIGGDSFEHFVQVIRTGVDPDHLHPPCTTQAIPQIAAADPTLLGKASLCPIHRSFTAMSGLRKATPC